MLHCCRWLRASGQSLNVWGSGFQRVCWPVVQLQDFKNGSNTALAEVAQSPGFQNLASDC